MNDYNFGPVEMEYLRKVEAELTAKLGRPRSIEMLIEFWRDTISSIETGYPYMVYDYYNDCDDRGLLESLISAQSCPLNLKQKLFSILKPLDDRFLAATREAPELLLRFANEIGTDWWDTRVPLKLVGPLLKDLGND